jgi:hypothetical protein
MKILFKQLSLSYTNGKISDTELALKFDNVIREAWANEIIIWHVGKKMVLTEQDFDYYVNLQNMTINWGGYGSRISKENLFDYFNFQYPGDEVKDGRLKSNVTIRKNPFKCTRAYFADDVDDAVKVEFQSLGGIVETRVSEQTIIAVSKNITNETAISSLFQGDQWSKIQFVSQDELVGLFPVKLDPQARQNADRIKPESELPKLYSSDVYEKSFINNKNEFAKLKKLLTAETVELIDSGLLLLSSIGDPVLFDALIEGVGLVELEVQSELIPNKLFTGTKKLQPLYNYAITGILKLSDSQSVLCNRLKGSIKKLRIDLPLLGHLDGLPNLEKLILIDSLQLIKSLDDISGLKNLSSLILENCPLITSIDGISNLPLIEFDFGVSKQIVSFAPLQGKADKTGLKFLSIIRFDKLFSLNGIEFYQSLSKISVDNCESLQDVSALDNLPNLVDIVELQPYHNKHNILLSRIQSVRGLIGRERDNLGLSISNWGELSDGIFDKMEYLSIHCSGMRDLNWLDKFPNLIGLSVQCNELDDVSAINKCEKLLGLIITSDSITDLTPLSKLTELVALNFNGCSALASIEFIRGMTNLKLCGDGFSDIIDVHSSYRKQEQTLTSIATKGESFWQEISLRNLPSLTDLSSLFQMNYISDCTNGIGLTNIGLSNYSGLQGLKKLTILIVRDGVVNDKLITELLTIPGFQMLKVDAPKIVNIQNNASLHFNMHFNFSFGSATNLILKNTKFKNLYFEYLVSKDFSFMEGVSVEELQIARSRELISLKGISNNNEIQKLLLEDMVGLESIEGLSGVKTLKHLSLKKIPKLVISRDLCAMDWLEDMYTEDCDSLEVKPKPKGQMVKMDLIKYQLKLAEFYQIKNTEKLLSQLESKKETKSSTLTPKEVGNIKKLLQSRDIDMVISAVNMVDSLSDEGLCDVLLEGVKMDGKQLVPNKLFTGTGPAQPFLNSGMLGVLCVASKFDKWSAFLSGIEDVEIETMVFEYLNAFTHAKTIQVWNVERINAPLSLPNLLSFNWGRRNYYENKSLSMALNVFANCIQLSKIHIDQYIAVSDDFTAIGNLVALSELSLIGISGNHITSIEGLSSCVLMEKIDLQFNEKNMGKIANLRGIEGMANLKYLSMIRTEITDTSGLAKLSNLEYIEILSPELVQFTPSENFEKLSVLAFGSMSYSRQDAKCKKLVSIGSSKYAENMKEINLAGTSISEFPHFTNTKSISFLTLSNTPICDFSKMNSVNSIEKLELESCPNIIDFKGFENVTSIGQFSIKSCASLKSFKGFENVKTPMKRLELVDCPLVENIEDLPKVEWERITICTEKLPTPNSNLSLKQLELPKVKSLQGLGAYKSVTGLFLVSGYYQGNHELEDFSQLEELLTLKQIKISSSKAISLKVFDVFDHLEVLNLVGSKNLSEPNELKKIAIDKLYIADCNLKKADFPEYLQNNIDWQSKP